ncbi:MAG: hypothetical protein D6710_02155 [Nitrospirae bacterium]|nr:MAG: hypothetical protein D6710_02155 [Nitrospirota bacterium]
MSPVFFFMVIFYWLFLSGSVFLAGSFIIKQLVTAPSGADFCIVKERGRCFGEVSLSIIFFVSLLTFLLNIVHLYFHASVMTETPLQETASVFSVFLAKTKYGRLGLFRTAFLILLSIIVFSCMRKPKGWKNITGTLLSLLLLISLSMSSHQAIKGYQSIPFYIDIIHIVSISIWIGGIFFIRLCYSFFLKEKAVEYWKIFQGMITRFSNIATIAVYIAGATGITLAFVRVKNSSILLNTIYGRVFLLKLMVVLTIFLLGGLNKFYVLPKLFSIENATNEKSIGYKKLLYRFITFEAVAGLLAIFLTAILTHLSPEG